MNYDDEPKWVEELRQTVSGPEVTVEHDHPSAVVLVRGRGVARVRMPSNGQVEYRRLVPPAGLGESTARAIRLKVLSFLVDWERKLGEPK